MTLFPMFLKLAGRECLVVGAGAEGESKIVSLLLAKARVQAVAPEATPTVRRLARSKKIRWIKRKFQASDLQGVYLVVAATSSAKAHRKIYREAQRRGILCNVADVPSLCDFYFPAVVRRGPLLIAISTSGQSPALAQRLRKQLEVQFGAEYESWLRQLGKARKKVLASTMLPAERKELLHRMASKEAFESHFRETTIPPRPGIAKRVQSHRKIRLS